MIYSVRYAQTVFDIAAQLYGKPEFAFIIAEDNNLQVTDYLEPGTQVTLQDSLLRSAPYVIANGYGARLDIDLYPDEDEVEDGGYEGEVVNDIVDGGYEGQEIGDVQEGNTETNTNTNTPT